MSTRRDALTQATLAALSLCTPRTLLALLDQVAAERYLIVALGNGRYLAVDSERGRAVQLLEAQPAADGEHRLSHGGSLVLKGGRLRELRGTPRTPHFELSTGRGEVIVRRRDRRGVPDLRIALHAR